MKKTIHRVLSTVLTASLLSPSPALSDAHARRFFDPRPMVSSEIFFQNQTILACLVHARTPMSKKAKVATTRMASASWQRASLEELVLQANAAIFLYAVDVLNGYAPFHDTDSEEFWDGALTYLSPTRPYAQAVLSDRQLFHAFLKHKADYAKVGILLHAKDVQQANFFPYWALHAQMAWDHLHALSNRPLTIDELAFQYYVDAARGRVPLISPKNQTSEAWQELFDQLPDKSYAALRDEENLDAFMNLNRELYADARRGKTVLTDEDFLVHAVCSMALRLSQELRGENLGSLTKPDTYETWRVVFRKTAIRWDTWMMKHGYRTESKAPYIDQPLSEREKILIECLISWWWEWFVNPFGFWADHPGNWSAVRGEQEFKMERLWTINTASQMNMATPLRERMARKRLHSKNFEITGSISGAGVWRAIWIALMTGGILYFTASLVLHLDSASWHNVLAIPLAKMIPHVFANVFNRILRLNAALTKTTSVRGAYPFLVASIQQHHGPLVRLLDDQHPDWVDDFYEYVDLYVHGPFTFSLNPSKHVQAFSIIQDRERARTYLEIAAATGQPEDAVRKGQIRLRTFFAGRLEDGRFLFHKGMKLDAVDDAVNHLWAALKESTWALDNNTAIPLKWWPDLWMFCREIFLRTRTVDPRRPQLQDVLVAKLVDRLPNEALQALAKRKNSSEVYRECLSILGYFFNGFAWKRDYPDPNWEQVSIEALGLSSHVLVTKLIRFFPSIAALAAATAEDLHRAQILKTDVDQLQAILSGAGARSDLCQTAA